MGLGNGTIFWGALVFACTGLSGCGMTQEGDGTVARFLAKSPEPGVSAADQKAARSDIISDLQGRRSILSSSDSFQQVATPILAAYSRAAESELKGARLRAQAASKNWLPQIGPNINLTSLSNIFTQLIVEQVLFDNGRKKAERAFAQADVEVAAVNLAEDTNERVLTGLTLYLDAEKARERVALESRTLKDMQRFEWVMNERVKGGISDASDLNVLRQKLAEIRATLAAQKEAEATALAELNAMSAHKLNDVRGLGNVSVGINDARPLDVLRAEAEKDRDVAQAGVDRAGQLPGVKASGTLGDNSDLGINVKSDQLLGLGTGDTLRAIQAEKEAAGRRVAQATEDSNRRLRRLEQRLAALSRQVVEAGHLTGQSKANLDLFQRQYDGGQRQVMDVVGVYETFAIRQTAQVALKYDLALTRLKIARELGLLADGETI